MKKRQNFIVPCGALFCCLLWGLAFPLTEWMYEGFCPGGTTVGDLLLMAGVRFCGAGLMLLLLAALRRGRPFQSIPCGSHLAKAAALGLLETGVQYSMFYLAMQTLPGGRASLINTTNAFFSVLLAHFFCRGDRLNAKKIAGCISGFAGIFLLLGGSGWAGARIGDVLMLLSALSFSAGNVVCQRLSRDMEPAALAAWQMLFGGAALLLIGLLAGGDLRGGTTAAWLLMVFFVFQSAAAFSVWSWLLSKNDVSQIGIYTCLIPVIGVFCTALLSGTKVSGKTLVSLLLVAGGVLIINCAPNKRENVKGEIPP